jgi:hypothetical protein
MKTKRSFPSWHVHIIGPYPDQTKINPVFKPYPISLNLNSVNQLIFVMVKCCVLFEVRAEFLNNI